MFLLSLFKHIPKRRIFKFFVICIFLSAICIPPIRNLKSIFVSCIFFFNVKLIGYTNKCLCLLRLTKLKCTSVAIVSSDELLPSIFKINADHLNGVIDWFAIKEIMTIIQIWRGLHQTFCFGYRIARFCFRRNDATGKKNSFDQFKQSDLNRQRTSFSRIIQNIKIQWKDLSSASRPSFLGTFWFRRVQDDKTKQIQRRFSYFQENVSKIEKMFKKVNEFYTKIFEICSTITRIPSKISNWLWQIYQIGNNFIENAQLLSISECKRAQPIF